MKRELFDWILKKDDVVRFTAEEVKLLLEHVKEFNCGAIDHLLTQHVDKVYEEWLRKKRS